MSKATNEIVKAWETVTEMLGDRFAAEGAPPGGPVAAEAVSGGEEVSSGGGGGGGGIAQSTSMGDVEIRALSEELPTFSISIAPGLAVVFHTAHSTVKKQEVFHLAESTAPEGATPHVLLILRNKNTATVKSLMTEASSRRVRMEIFSIQELQYNPARHNLVPKHVKVAKESEDDILRAYTVHNRFMLPLIIQSDAMARYLGLQHGDIVRVERPSPTAGIAVVYRVCM